MPVGETPSGGGKAEHRSRLRLRDLGAWLDREIASLSPGCFALVMATGIISNAMYFEGRREWSDALFAVAVIAYFWLFLLTLARSIFFWRKLWADLVNPQLVFSFFTIVAGTDVLGVGVQLRGFANLALPLWLFALALWVALIYFSFGVLTFLNGGARGANVIHGGWLIAIVGAESLVILGAIVAPLCGEFAPAVIVLIHMLWAVGLLLYGAYVILFAHRIFFFDVEPEDLTPVLWVVMGAAAIGVNAGAGIVLVSGGMPLLQSMRPVIDAITLVLWAWATWWIPLLLLFGVWKYGVRGAPLTYTPMLWSFVFPLGMYSLATLRIAFATGFQPFESLSHAMAWVALAAWTATAAGLAGAFWRSLRASVKSGGAPLPL